MSEQACGLERPGTTQELSAQLSEKYGPAVEIWPSGPCVAVHRIGGGIVMRLRQRDARRLGEKLLVAAATCRGEK